MTSYGQGAKLTCNVSDRWQIAAGETCVVESIWESDLKIPLLKLVGYAHPLGAWRFRLTTPPKRFGDELEPSGGGDSEV